MQCAPPVFFCDTFLHVTCTQITCVVGLGWWPDEAQLTAAFQDYEAITAAVGAVQRGVLRR